MAYIKYRRWKHFAISYGLNGFTLGDLADYFSSSRNEVNIIYIFSEYYKMMCKKKRKRIVK